MSVHKNEIKFQNAALLLVVVIQITNLFLRTDMTRKRDLNLAHIYLSLKILLNKPDSRVIKGKF